MAEQAAPVVAPPQAPQAGPAIARDPEILAIPELRLQFGRLNSTRTRVNVNINPGQLERVYQAEYLTAVSTLGGLIAVDITPDQYIRMSRTILLKRLMDIHEYQTGVRPNPVLQFARGFDVLRPSAELLYALGPYFCETNGKQYHLTYPPPPQVDPPNWYTFDGPIYQNYRLFVDQVRQRYDTLSFPKMSDMNGHPLMFTRGQEANDLKSVRASINIPRPSDALLRFVHEDGFITNNVPEFNDCSLIMTEQLYTQDLITRYVRSYVRGVNV